MASFQGGFYDLKDMPVGEHAYVIADGERRTYFECYGGTNGPKNQYPAELYTGDLIWYKKLGKSVNADLTLAIVASSGQKAWREHFDRKTGGTWLFGDSSGIVYAVTGVCHQMANRVLYATNGPDNDQSDRCVVWPPSLSATVLVYGFFGGLKDIFPLYWKRVRDIYRGQAMAIGATAGGADVETNDAGAQYVRDSVREHLRSAHLPQTRAEILTSVLARPGVAAAQKAEIPSAVQQEDSAFARVKRDLDVQLIRGEIAPAAYAGAVNGEFAKYMGKLSAALGPERFRERFGETIPTQLVNPAYMLEGGAYQQFKSEVS